VLDGPVEALAGVPIDELFAIRAVGVHQPNNEDWEKILNLKLKNLFLFNFNF